MVAETPEAAQSLLRSPASPSETSIVAVVWSAHGLRQHVARLRHAIAQTSISSRDRIGGQPSATAPPVSTSRPSAASPIVPVTRIRSPGRAPVRLTIRPGGTRPKAVIEIICGPGVDTVSPPCCAQAKVLASSPSASAKGPSQAILLAAQGQRQHEAGRHRALGREIGEVHPQRLARDGVGRIGGKIMHAFDDGVGGDNDVLAGRGQDRGIIDQPQRAGIGRQRLEIARDEGVFGGGIVRFASSRSATTHRRHRPA